MPAPATSTPRLRVFLDCSDCFPDFLREEIRWVDFVRQPQDADVHLLTRSSDTGGGGREIALRFVGNLRFNGVDQELKALSHGFGYRRHPPPERAARGHGRAPRLHRTRRPPGRRRASRSKRARPDAAAAPARDPWNFWVFGVEAGGSIQAEETERQWDWSADLTADRVTERWKLNFGASLEHETEEFDPR